MDRRLSAVFAWGLAALLLVFALLALIWMPLINFLWALLCAGVVLGRAFFGNRRLEKLPDWVLAGLAVTFAAMLRVVWLLTVRVQPVSDFARFVENARMLIQGDISPAAHYIAMFPHTLGYPYFLSLLFRLFGSSVWAGQIGN